MGQYQVCTGATSNPRKSWPYVVRHGEHLARPKSAILPGIAQVLATRSVEKIGVFTYHRGLAPPSPSIAGPGGEAHCMTVG